MTFIVLLVLLAPAVRAEDSRKGFASFAAVIPGGPTGYLVYPWTGTPLPLRALGGQIDALVSGGSVLYASAHRAHGVRRIDLLSGQISLVRGSEPFPFIDGVAVSAREDVIIVRSRDNTFFGCGIFSLSELEGEVHTVREHDECSKGWEPPSISPDGRRILLERGRYLEVLDVETGSSTRVGDYEHASWAPNGKWIAVFGNGN